MKRTGITMACVALLPGLALSGPVGDGGPAANTTSSPSQVSTAAQAPAAMSFTLTESKTETGCKLSVKAWNKGQQQVAISRDSQVRVANLTWKKLGQSIRINAGQTKTWTYDLLFSCGTTREYRFLVKQFDANDNLLNQYWYAPAAGSGSSLGLGDLNRFF